MAKGRKTPVVRVPGFTRDELRLVDRAATLKGWSRAQWLRAVAVEAARQPSQATPSPASNGGVVATSRYTALDGPNGPVQRAADAAVAVRRGLKPGERRPSWSPTSEPDGPTRHDD